MKRKVSLGRSYKSRAIRTKVHCQDTASLFTVTTSSVLLQMLVVMLY